jgi:hypothetical protein
MTLAGYQHSRGAVMTLDSQFLLSNRTSHFDCHTYENLTILKKFREMHGFFLSRFLCASAMW